MQYNRYNIIVIHQLVRACIIPYNTYVCIKMWPDFGKTTSYAQGHIYNYVIQLFNKLYLKNAWGCSYIIFYYCTVIKDISVHQLFNE